MRRLVLIAVTVLALVVSAGCGALPVPAAHRSPTPAGTVLVDLSHDVTAQQKQLIASALRSIPGVQSVVYVSQEESYRRAKKIFKDRPDMLKYLRPEALSDMYQVRLTDRGKAQQVIAKVRGMPGVGHAALQPTATPTAHPS